MNLKELAKWIGAEVIGDPNIDITSANTLEEARPGQLSFLANAKYAKQLETTGASAVVAGLAVSSSRVALLKAQNPYYAFTQAVVILHGYRKHPHRGAHPNAYVDPTATIGEGTVIYPGCYVGSAVKVGRDCILYPNVVIYEQCVLGDRVTVHAGTVIGEDGFGYATHNGQHHKIPQVGNVIIEDDVELGANCTIDRGTLGSTIIGHGTKTSNLVAIGHNTVVGPHALLVAQVGIAGSVCIGHHATIAGQAGVAGHLKLGDNVTVAAQSGVMNDIPDQTTVMGAPAMPVSQARRVISIFTQLPALLDRIKQLEEAVSELSAGDEPGKP